MFKVSDDVLGMAISSSISNKINHHYIIFFSKVHLFQTALNIDSYSSNNKKLIYLEIKSRCKKTGSSSSSSIVSYSRCQLYWREMVPCCGGSIWSLAGMAPDAMGQKSTHPTSEWDEWPTAFDQATPFHVFRATAFSLAVGEIQAAWQVRDRALCGSDMKAGYSHHLHQMQVHINKTEKYLCLLYGYIHMLRCY